MLSSLLLCLHVLHSPAPHVLTHRDSRVHNNKPHMVAPQQHLLKQPARTPTAHRSCTPACLSASHPPTPPHPLPHVSCCVVLCVPRYRGFDSLEFMLRHAGHAVDVLYYEVLDIPLPQLEQLKTLRVRGG